MKVHHKGEVPYLRNDDGTVCGVWVPDLDTAQLDTPLKANLRMFLASLPGDPSTGVSREHVIQMYAAVAEGNFRIQRQDPAKGGGYWVVLGAESKADSLSRAPAASDKRPWWKMW